MHVYMHIILYIHMHTHAQPLHTHAQPLHTHAQPLHTHAQPSPSDLRGTVPGVHTFQMPMRPPSSACMPDPTLFWDTSTSAARVFGQREHRRCDHYPRGRHPLMPSLPRLRTACVCVPIALVGPCEHVCLASAFAAAPFARVLVCAGLHAALSDTQPPPAPWVGPRSVHTHARASTAHGV